MSDWPASVGLVGCGAMGRAFAAGLARGRPELAAGFRFADAVPSNAAAAREEVGAGAVGSVADAGAADLVVVAVKPKDAEAALGELAPGLREDALLLSLMAGVTLARLRAAVGSGGIVRAMPNLAVRHGAGIVALAGDGVAAERLGELCGLLAPLGTVVPLSEALLGPATALVGSGPGFVAVVAEGLEDGAVAVGFTREQARELVHGVIAGTGALLADGTDPAELRQRVSSPAGTTVEGIAALERGAVRAHVADAVRAAARRAAEL